MKSFGLVYYNSPIEILSQTKKPFFIICQKQNDCLGKKVRVKCNSDDTISDLKKLIAVQTGTKAEKTVLKKWCKFFFLFLVEILGEFLIIFSEICIFFFIKLVTSNRKYLYPTIQDNTKI